MKITEKIIYTCNGKDFLTLDEAKAEQAKVTVKIQAYLKAFPELRDTEGTWEIKTDSNYHICYAKGKFPDVVEYAFSLRSFEDYTSGYVRLINAVEV